MGQTSLDDNLIRRLRRIRYSLKKKYPSKIVNNSVILHYALNCFEKKGSLLE